MYVFVKLNALSNLTHEYAYQQQPLHFLSSQLQVVLTGDV